MQKGKVGLFSFLFDNARAMELSNGWEGAI